MDTDNAISAGEAAANWWLKALEQPSFEFGIDTDAALMLKLQKTEQSCRTNTEEAVRPVIELIREVVDHAFATNRINQWEPLILKTDYRPEELLENIAIRAGTNITWPYKTVMRIYPDHIEVTSGHLAKAKTIWQQS